MGTEDDSLLAKVAASPVRAPPPTPLQGTRRFELRRRLGAGAFGEVYEARDRESGAPMAVKVLRDSSGPDRLFRFKREFRAVADIAHPNLVRLYELIHEDDTWYLTMELVDGLPFAEHVRRAPEQLRSCFAQLARAIDTLHGAGRLHRDIKPTNVLVERTGRVVLLDFGLVLTLDAQQNSAIAGTPHYMAPEQLAGGELTAATDWYAFGVMLYQSLAGVLPFDGLKKHLRRELPPAPSTIREGVDMELERLCMRLLSHVAADRPGAAEVLETLSAADASDDSPAREAEPFAGRRRELDDLRAAFRDVSEHGALVLVQGQAGIGKTSLAQAFASEAREQGALVFSGRCYEAESVPFKGVDAVVDSITEYLRRLPPIEAAALLPRDAQALAMMFPVLKRVDAFAQVRHPRRSVGRGPHENRRAALRAFKELMTRLSDTAPVVVFVDDLHWATDDGVHLLLDLLSPPTPPVLFVVACRQEAMGRSPTLDRFIAHVEAAPDLVMRKVELAPLTRAEVDELLAAEAAGRLDGSEAWRETGGHPFLLTRLLRARVDANVGAGLARVLDEQFDHLSAPAREVLEVVSLSAASLTQGAACEAAGVPKWDPQLVDELRVSKLIRSAGYDVRAVIEPYHDQVRERLLDTLSEERRRGLHLKLARYLETSRLADADAIAHHYAGAEDRGRAIVWMRRAAAASTESLAFAKAAELYGQAAALSQDPDERIDLTIDHAEAMVLDGRRGDAGRACLAACEIARQSGAEKRLSELRGLAGEHFMLGGNFQRGTELLREALAGIDITLPTSVPLVVQQSMEQLGALVARGFEFERRDASELSPHALRRVDLELTAARSLAQSDIRAPFISIIALREALDLGEPQRVQRAFAYFAFVNSSRLADQPLGELVLAKAESLARELEDDAGLAWTIMSRAFILLYRRDVEPAFALMKDSERRFLSLSRPLVREAGIARIGLLTLCGNYGYDLPFARDARAGWIAEALDREDLTPVTWLRLVGVWVDLALDDTTAARANLRAALDAWAGVEDEIFLTAGLMAELGVAIYSDPTTAWEECERLGAVFSGMFASKVPAMQHAFLRHRASAALCAHQAGKASREETTARVEECARSLDSNPIAVDTLDVLHGHLAALKGDLPEAARRFQRAADSYKSKQQKTHALLALLRSAQARGDGVEQVAAELVALGVVAPERYATVYVGPPPAGSSPP